MMRTIEGKEYNFPEAKIDVSDLRFWPENPRIRAEIYPPYGGEQQNLTGSQLQDAVYSKLKKRSNAREFQKQIKSFGLTEPLIVRRNVQDGSYDVLEGNRRLAACKEILQKAERNQDDETVQRFSSLPCEIVSGEITANHIFALISTLHIHGKDQWSPFAKASYVKQRVEVLLDEGYPDAMEIVAKGMTESIQEIRTLIANIDLMKFANEKMFDKYSLYNEVNRNSIVRQDLKNNALKRFWISCIREWDGTAQAFRSAIKAVTMDKKVLKKFREGKINLEDAAERSIESGSTDDLVQKIKRFRKSINAYEKRITSINRTDTAFNKIKYEVEKLKTLTEDIHRKLVKKSG